MGHLLGCVGLVAAAQRDSQWGQVFCSAPITLVTAMPVRVHPRIGEEYSTAALISTSYYAGPVYAGRLIAAGADPAVAVGKAAMFTALHMQQQVMGAGRSTIIGSHTRGRRPRWRRVSDGQPCTFCAMLVGRGPVYSDEGVRFRSHPSCGCTAEPVFGQWEPTDLERQWLDAYHQAAKTVDAQLGRGKRSLDTVLPRMRRTNPHLFADGVGKGSRRPTRKPGGPKPITAGPLPESVRPSSDGHGVLERHSFYRTKVLSTAYRAETTLTKAPLPSSLLSRTAPESKGRDLYLDTEMYGDGTVVRTRSQKERDFALLLEEHFGSELLSLRPSTKPGEKIPDLLFPSGTASLEMKIISSSRTTTISSRLGSGSGQSVNVALRILSTDVSEKQIIRAIEDRLQYKQDIRSIIVLMPDGEWLYWFHG